ncbi:Transglycosylase SLT domain protein [compost metagenome]
MDGHSPRSDPGAISPVCLPHLCGRGSGSCCHPAGTFRLSGGSVASWGSSGVPVFGGVGRDIDGAKSIVSVTRGAGLAPDVERPWPWTINVAGKGYRYARRLQAWEALQRFLKTHPRKRIDVGIAQVNLGWNGHHFTSTWEAFEPYTNLNAAAAILRECYDRNPGSWLTAAGCYHHPAGGAPAARYKSIVSGKLARLNSRTSAPTRVANTTLTPMVLPAQTAALTWIEPRSQ